MKNKFKFLKLNWWKIIIYILINLLGLLLLYFVNINELKFLIKKLGFIGNLMCVGYLLIWNVLSNFLIYIIEFLKKIKKGSGKDD
ncbi:Spiroplasmavirus-related protein [Spiroplasma melliferum]|uniref:Spiroplasmavirus-related protein n=1 Tax=Spiroplasma melliferum TaxID=2134 RepID=A0ABX5U807_SPIME|nr:Spiroplasmavirus-related protein [Spiroplasma melliferum]QCO23814.1 Spiroplasmavirus-related protein [Spiroplasma melliferum]